MIYKAVLLTVLILFARLSGQMPGEQRLAANLELHQVSTPEASLAILKSLLRHGGIVDTSAAGCNPPERHSVFVPWGADTSTARDLGVPRDGRWLWILDGDVVNVLA